MSEVDTEGRAVVFRGWTLPRQSRVYRQQAGIWAITFSELESLKGNHTRANLELNLTNAHEVSSYYGTREC